MKLISACPIPRCRRRKRRRRSERQEKNCFRALRFAPRRPSAERKGTPNLGYGAIGVDAAVLVDGTNDLMIDTIASLSKDDFAAEVANELARHGSGRYNFRASSQSSLTKAQR